MGAYCISPEDAHFATRPVAIYRSSPAAKRKATLFAGPPAAGKSTLMGAPATDLAEYRQIDADDFKTLLLRSAVLDGSISTLLPEALRGNQKEQFHPLELSALVHHESTILQARALIAAMRAGENVAIDGTLGYMPWATELVGQLGDFGYEIHVIDVEATQEIALARVIDRWRAGYARATAFPSDPVAAMGGRWLPASAVTRLFTAAPEVAGTPLVAGCSTSETNAHQLAAAFPEVVKYDLYRTTALMEPPKHEQSWKRTGSGDWATLSIQPSNT